jgi:TonB-dependent SusC/RagA subfamily outer membrane receptor
MRRFFVVVTLAALASGQRATAQQQEQDRAPRFLLASDSRLVPVDVRATPLLGQRLSLALDGATVKQALAEIVRQSGLRLVYSDDVLPARARVRLHAEGITVAAALMDVLFDAGLDVVFSPNGRAALVRRGAVFQTGTVAGLVTDSLSGQGLPGIVVFLDRTSWSATTDADGRYRLTEVTPGTYTLVARRIGYARFRREVIVQPEQELRMDVALVPAPSELTAVVVTATGEQRLLELGHVVGRINADSLVRETPVSNISELLTGRVPGVQVFQTQGTVGGDVQLQVRTPNSLLLSTQPIVIVDGVRYTSDPALQPFERAALTGAAESVNREPTSPLNDLNPNDIESIQVVKGPSAATLYGTDAANGVLIVTTKRGRPGLARWNTYTRLGITEPSTIRPPTRYWAWSTGSSGQPNTFNCSLSFLAFGFCTTQDSITAIPNVLDDPSRTILGDAPRWAYGLNVSGGRPELRYYFAGDFEQATGPFRMPRAFADSIAQARGTSLPEEQLKPNAFSNVNLRSNLTTVVAGRIELQANLGYVRRSNRTLSLTLNPYQEAASGGTPTRPYGFNGPPAASFSTMSTEDVDRFLVGGRAQGRITPWLLVRGAVGLDLTVGTRHTLARRGEATTFACCPDLGSVRDDRFDQRTTTADLGLTASFGRGRISWRTTVGAQYVRALSETQTASGFDLVPGGESVIQAASRSSDQAFIEQVTLGSYLEQSVGLNDRLFVTGALRADGASTFGQDYEAAVYPKASVSWLVSEEPFLPRLPGLDELRLRYAFGASGRQPLPTMTLPTFTSQPGTVDGTSGTVISVEALGNAQLRPERAREHEFGLDAAALGRRMQVELTWYRRRVVDQIVQQALPPGLGSIFTNLGLTTARGFEAQLTTSLFDTRQLTWDVIVRHSSSSTLLVDIGDAPEDFTFSGGYREGYPLGARFRRRLLGFADANGDGIIESSELQLGDTAYVGQSTPTRNQTLATVFGLFSRRLRVSLLFDREAGFSQLLPDTCNSFGCLPLLDPKTPLEDQAAVLASRPGPLTAPVAPGDFTRLREVTVALELPAGMLHPVGLRSGLVSVSARNLALWTKFRGGDPESAFLSGLNSVTSTGGIPQSRSWTFRVDLGL